MEVLSLQVFVSLLLVTGAVAFFVLTVRRRDHEHADRLALLPIEDEPTHGPSPAGADATPHASRPRLRGNA